MRLSNPPVGRARIPNPGPPIGTAMQHDRFRCAIYARVSTEAQREKHTIDSQLRLLPEYATQRGWTIVEEYVDNGFSGETIEGRPAFSRLLDDATRQLFDVVLVIDEDRITRSNT